MTSHAGDPIEFSIPEPHVEAKVRARDEVYSILTRQLGPVITEIPRSQLASEVIIPAQRSLPAPDAKRVLRYERRAQLLLERGVIERKITYAEHYVPLAESLLSYGATAGPPATR